MPRHLPWVCAVTLVLVGSLHGQTAYAAPPGNWSLGVERLFGFSRVTSEVEVGNDTVSTTDTSVSLFSVFSGRRGYSTPRLALDYLADSGLSIGGALAYETRDTGGGADDNTWLFAARIGYFALPAADFAIWPRAGLTHIAFDVAGDDDDSVTALTLEVPLVFLIFGRRVGLTFTPHADIGIAGGTDDFDRKLTELGFQFGANAFF